MPKSSRYIIRFFFEWGGGWLWGGNAAAYLDFDFGAIEGLLPLSQALLDRGDALSVWHDRSLNWEYPPDPGPWRQDECDRFNAAAHAFFADVQQELGEKFEILYQQQDVYEDPDLDEYLKAPQYFRRKLAS
jgi:hypothetical protein